MSKNYEFLSLFLLVIFAEIKRTFQEKITYRTQMVLGALTGLVGLVQFAILGHYISMGGKPPGLEQYGDSLISFMIVGSLFSAIALMMMNSLKMQIQTEQQRGTLEAIVLSRAGLFQFLTAGSIFGVITSMISAVIIFASFGILFDFALAINPLSLVFTIVVAVICMWLIGLWAASYILISKQGEPVTWTVTTLLTLFSGVMYPITVFPEYVVNALQLLPTVGMLHSLRISLFSEAPLHEVVYGLFPTLVTIAVLGPLSVIAWRYSLMKARYEGSLGSY